MYKVMIVDDSNIIRNSIERNVDEGKYEIVAKACDGYDAVAKFKELRPQIVTMDLTMPGKEGLEAIQEIYDMDNSVSILVVSALSDKLTGLMALEYGAQGFIYKPFTEEELNSALEKIVKQRESMAQEEAARAAEASKPKAKSRFKWF